MNNPTANFLSGLLGGLIVLVLGAILISTDIIDTGDSSTVVQRQSPMTQPTSDSSEGGRTVRDIYASEGRGVAFISAQGVSSEEETNPFGTPRGGYGDRLRLRGRRGRHDPHQRARRRRRATP